MEVRKVLSIKENVLGLKSIIGKAGFYKFRMFSIIFRVKIIFCGNRSNNEAIKILNSFWEVM
jgi:hypothetical protein